MNGISLLVISLLCGVGVYIISFKLYSNRKLGVVYVLGYLWYCSLYFVLNKNSILPSPPDSETFRLAFDEGTQAELSGAYATFSEIVAPLRLLGLGPDAYVIISSALFILGGALIWESWQEFNKESQVKSSEYVFSILIFSWPAAILYIPVVLRESLVIFSWGLLVYSVAYLSKNSFQASRVVLLSGSLFGLHTLRPELLPVSLILTVIWISVNKIGLIPLTIFSPAGALLFLTAIWSSEYRYLLIPESLERLREMRATRSSLGYFESVNWASWADVLGDSVSLTVLLLTSPIFTSRNPLSRLIAMADSIFILLLLGLSLLYILTEIGKGHGQVLVWVFPVVLISVGIGILEYHLTGAVRHRMIIVILLMPMAASIIGSIIDKRYIIEFSY